MSRGDSRWLGALAAASGLALASGCAGRGPEPRFDDDVLFAAVADLDGVISTELSYTDDLGRTRLYSGRVEVDAEADARCVLYQAVGLVMQGRPEVGTPVITVLQGTTRTATSDLPFRVWSGLEALAAGAGPTPTVPDCADAGLG